MNRLVTRCSSLAVAAVVVAALSAVAAGPAGAKGSSTPTCSQLTATQLKPLLADTFVKLVSKPISGTEYFVNAKQVGQNCVVTTNETSSALGVTVIGGPAAAKAWQSELQSLGAHVSVPGVGTKAVRAKVDDGGGVSTAEILALKGSTFCRVEPGDVDNLPDAGVLEEAAGSTGNIGDQAYSTIATALGTVCNRIFGSGNTTVDLSKLASITVPSTTEGGLDGIPGT